MPPGRTARDLAIDVAAFIVERCCFDGMRRLEFQVETMLWTAIVAITLSTRAPIVRVGIR